ncbi:hypothetical protein STSP2_00211 [Anaerohalosphaera lusitana]|uniref:ASCH domain-containing protein n=1 Tax=Anaerohalosphaera lusitana TaxID=1936003 RepID=A0A1U9NGJ9_9BACT|nr:ASCH domain-containing protein [Anaerohalosphaera lusitana]AQT67071.1 hypothetical protein STSP2_00211 [Anaerohalosphaera lusitana]
MKTAHLVILKRPYLAAILAGSKTVEFRLTKDRRAPFGCVKSGHTLYLKQSSGPVLATATVARVHTEENLTPARIRELKSCYNNEIQGPDTYWAARENANYATLIWLKDIKKIPPRTIQKTDQRPWVVLTEKENFGLL